MRRRPTPEQARVIVCLSSGRNDHCRHESRSTILPPINMYFYKKKCEPMDVPVGMYAFIIKKKNHKHVNFASQKLEYSIILKDELIEKQL